MALHDVSSAQFGGNIQAAIDHCEHLGGGTVYIPAGTYSLDSPLRVKSPMSIVGDGPWSSTLRGPGAVSSPAIHVEPALGATSPLSGVVIDKMHIKAIGGRGIVISRCWGTRVSNVVVDTPSVGFAISDVGPLDMDSIYVNGATDSAIRMQHSGTDLFLSKVHVNNGSAPNASGLHLNCVSGAHITDSDFIGGKLGVVVTAVGGNSDWLKFTSVSADTVTQDPWHLAKTRGMQMTNCWSGSFLQGTGIWVGADVKQLSIVNHQWQQGRIGIGNNSDSVYVVGGIMGDGIATHMSTSKTGWPRIFNVFGL